MSDTQWPSYVVFEQARSDQPHQYAGSVHATDAELAMLNARDVFSRRPEIVSLWTVRADRIFARTAQELELHGVPAPSTDSAGETQTYLVFQKQEHKSVHSHIGEVQADSPESALYLALKAYPSTALVWWIILDSAITRSKPEDIDALFQMAESKYYRDQGFFHTVATLREIKSRSITEHPDE
jgi:ring-1,2-phenylacetyl-CoA epoxidase subunit PaaB